MTRHAAELLAYVMRRLPIKDRDISVRREQASAWLDQHCSGWRDHTKPRIKRRVVIVTKEDEEDEE
ncbi:hypothetical protein KDN34_03030 [Shewanella yunxiaonensis]|uniref:Uncharacterized protein n=1 Tax=Shewanella yunxiaonensis TaxID=2829809 RepID=A0ABX7YUI4_9GAMM|nr:hypothetical protein [Shewanella yunxiaonensis]QUN06453.1 hypothetical protein KDN34_03030 [Shewanella yunxiaonensis]